MTPHGERGKKDFMKTTQRTVQNTDVQAVSAQPKRKKAEAATAETTDFGRVIQTMLGRKGASTEMSEEDLFAAATFKVIKELHGVELARDFKSAFKLARIEKLPNEIVASNERATKEALNFFVKSTILTKEQANQIRDIAAQVCQLDNKQAIWDEFGKTKAVTTFADAQVTIQERLAEAISGAGGGGGDEGSEGASALARKKAGYAASEQATATRRSSRRAPRGVKTVG